MMAAQRHFLGWDAPVVDKVREYLIPHAPETAVDLRQTLVLVPTRQAGRRLRETLTVYCSRHGVDLSAPVLRTPLGLLNSEAGPVASRIDTLAVWTSLLHRIEVEHFSAIFPNLTVDRDFQWALCTAQLLQSLRDELAEHGLTAEAVVTTAREQLEEYERWDDIARLEAAFVSQLESNHGLRDPSRELLRQARAPRLEDGCERIVVACVPDPSPIALLALEAIAGHVPVTILVHAPETFSSTFDAWGRPITAYWKSSHVDVPDAARSILLASSPSAQGELVAAVLERDGTGPGDVAIGVPDSAVIPHLEAVVSERGVPTYDAAGAPFSRHPVYRLLQDYANLVADRSYRSFAALLRNADVLDHLLQSQWIPPGAVLTELDRLHTRHMPETVEDVLKRLARTHSNPEDTYPALAAAVAALRTVLTVPRDGAAGHPVRQLLQEVYSTRRLHPGAPDDDEFQSAADGIDEALHLVATGCVPSLGFSPGESLELVLRHLGAIRYPVDRPAGAIDLQGWLELHWDDAPLLIITGMNEGAVPGRHTNTAFLPDSLRQVLGMRTNDDRFARDIYLLTAMIESRRAAGHVYLVAGKCGIDGEPLHPSRLLLQCPDDELPSRARRLFGAPDDVRPSVPSSVSFTLRPWVPAVRDSAKWRPVSLPVTAFQDYLRCPFRFYLKHVLHMERLADTKREMDALDFGSLLHEALARMSADPEMRECTSEPTLERFLLSAVDSWLEQRFGPSLPFRIEVQRDSARDRLAAAAPVLVQETLAGWEPVLWESSMEMECGSALVRGRVDRVDRHRHTGQIRILDYKTSEAAETPQKRHLATPTGETRPYALVEVGEKQRRWIDLQLPLYILMVGTQFGPDAEISAGYFTLPAETDETGVQVWGDLTPDQLSAALECANGVVEDIRGHRFWPPTEKIPNDDFESMFPGATSAFLDHEGFTQFLEGWQP